MKKRVLALALLVAVLTGCAGKDASSPVTGGAAWSFPEGPAPAEEYERFSWYGFGEENPDRNPSAAATEKEMADMLAAVIEAAGGDVEGWRELTAHASDEGIYRDYCAMFLLYAAEHMDATEFTMGFAPYLLGGRTDENWDAFGTDIRGGYRLFEEFGENWDRVCVSVSSQMEDRQEMNYLNASQNCVHLLAVPAALEVPFGGKSVPLADCYAAAGPARCREALGEVFALPEDTDYLAIAPAVLTKLAARYGAVRVGFTGALTPEQLARYGKGTEVQGISAADAHSFLAALDADTSLSPRRSAAARAAVWDAFFRQALELLPTTLPQGLREVSGSLLTSLTAVDLATLERTLEFLATSAEPVDITADALPGDWAGGHYTVSDASRAAVQSFFNLSPAAAQSASGSEP